jgi:hypothetical protein
LSPNHNLVLKRKRDAEQLVGDMAIYGWTWHYSSCPRRCRVGQIIRQHSSAPSYEGLLPAYPGAYAVVPVNSVAVDLINDAYETPVDMKVAATRPQVCHANTNSAIGVHGSMGVSSSIKTSPPLR